LKIAAKPLPVETWLLLTAYKKLSSSYPTVPSPISTTYRSATIPHDWHSRVCNDSSMSNKVNDFYAM